MWSEQKKRRPVDTFGNVHDQSRSVPQHLVIRTQSFSAVKTHPFPISTRCRQAAAVYSGLSHGDIPPICASNSSILAQSFSSDRF
jgi:hypothetical protein